MRPRVRGLPALGLLAACALPPEEFSSELYDRLQAYQGCGAEDFTALALDASGKDVLCFVETPGEEIPATCVDTDRFEDTFADCDLGSDGARCLKAIDKAGFDGGKGDCGFDLYADPSCAAAIAALSACAGSPDGSS